MQHSELFSLLWLKAWHRYIRTLDLEGSKVGKAGWWKQLRPWRQGYKAACSQLDGSRSGEQTGSRASMKLKTHPQVPLSPARLHLLELPQTLRTLALAGDQVFKSQCHPAHLIVSSPLLYLTLLEAVVLSCCFLFACKKVVLWRCIFIFILFFLLMLAIPSSPI